MFSWYNVFEPVIARIPQSVFEGGYTCILMPTEKRTLMSAVTYVNTCMQYIAFLSSRKHLRTKVTQDLHLTYSKNGGNLGLVLK